VAFINDEEGVSVVEYALLVALIALVVAGVATMIGNTISTMFTNTAIKIDSAGT
jgi:pilus assembly protein Flp/PilA